MAETQREAYEALAKNFAAANRRSIGLANEGLEFMRLQEDSARAAQEWFANGVRLLQLQQRNAEFVQGWTSDVIEALSQQTEHNVRTAEAFAQDRKSTRLNSSHANISYAVFCLKKKITIKMFSLSQKTRSIYI